MERLNEKQWKAFPIMGMFEKLTPGKGKGLNHLEQIKDGINYVGATNRGNGVLCTVAEDEKTNQMIQDGNCVGFIKNGDGSAGYAIYKQEPFISTSDVIYGYADWLNRDNGLFFVAAQDLIEDKHSHGYKRNQQHLRGDKVMLPVDDKGKPDYAYMTLYSTEMRGGMLMRYKNFIAGQLSQLEHKDIPALGEKKWDEFVLDDIFTTGAGKRLETRNKVEGMRPFIGATDNGNGVTGFVGNDNASKDSNVLGVNYDGAPCIAFYHPYECIFTDSVKRLHLKNQEDNKFVLLFFTSIFAMQRVKYSYGYKFKEKRMHRQKLMLPVTDGGRPDYEYMEQYIKNMMLHKYEQYLGFIERQSSAEEVDS